MWKCSNKAEALLSGPRNFRISSIYNSGTGDDDEDNDEGEEDAAVVASTDRKTPIFSVVEQRRLSGRNIDFAATYIGDGVNRPLAAILVHRLENARIDQIYRVETRIR